MSSNNALTKIFLTQWGKSTDEANVILYSREWWKTNSSAKHASLRLTDAGLAFLSKTLKLHSYNVPFSVDIGDSPQTMIFLGRYIKCPYFLTPRNIIVFSELVNFELRLFSDDIRKYGIIKSLKARNG